jgi:hypothetical protein
MNFTLTDEQIAARDLFQTGQTLAIEAGAGTGKTATLIALAESAPDRRGQYVAFNKAIVEEAKLKMPSSVRCNTAHSLAFRDTGKRYAARLKTPRQTSSEVAAFLGVKSIKVTTFDGSSKTVSASFLGSLAMRAITRFCQTADPEPTRRHVPWVEGLDAPVGDDRGSTRTRTNNDLIAREIEPALRRAWADLSETSGFLRFQHDHYLKLWQLSGPTLDVDYILFDEAQDANPVIVAVVAAQAERGVQVVWVGDSQQEIYAFTGAVNALASVPADQRAFLTQSFRFGPAIATQANEILATIASAEIRLVGLDSIDSRVEPVEAPRCTLTRTNAEAVRVVLDAQTQGRAAHIVGGGRDVLAFARAAERLMNGQSANHPELACFDSWAEVEEYVSQDELGAELQMLVKLVNDFGVPTIIQALDRMPREDDADLIVSTAHKAKGREWDSVQLASDFTIVRDGERHVREGDAERRLLYVAVTRARLQLDVTALPSLSAPESDEPVEVDEPVAVAVATPEKAAEAVSVAADLRGFIAPDVDARRDLWHRLGGTDETYRRTLGGAA